jgi:hypothetical protein
MKATAIAAALVATYLIACRLLPAQPAADSSLRDARLEAAARLDHAARHGLDQRAATLGAEFDKALSAAVQDEVIKPEQAQQMLRELEAELTIKRVRLELLRAIAMLDKAATSTPQSEELQTLRRQLKDATSALQPRYQPADPPQGLGLPLNQRPVDVPTDAPPGLRGTDPVQPNNPFSEPSVAKPEN